jgi:transposase InsO family protein
LIKLLDLESRTLVRWAKAGGPRKRGRLPHAPQEFEQARPQVHAVLEELGYKTGKDTVKDQCPDLPLRVINPLLRILKGEYNRDQELQRRKNRIHVQVLAKGTMVAQDSTHVGSVRGRKAWAEVAKDAATCKSHAFGDGKPLTGAAMLGHLQAMKSRSELPLVLATDNGSAYKEATVQNWLAQERVIHLFSLPHTPQHNGRAERCIGEGKALAGLGKGVGLQKAADGVSSLDKAFQTLNQHWPRRSKGGFTANQLDQLVPHWCTRTSRDEFYKATQKAVREATAGLKGRALRKATREAIFRTLEWFGLILRTRGELKPSKELQDRIS